MRSKSKKLPRSLKTFEKKSQSKETFEFQNVASNENVQILPITHTIIQHRKKESECLYVNSNEKQKRKKDKEPGLNSSLDSKMAMFSDDGWSSTVHLSLQKSPILEEKDLPLENDHFKNNTNIELEQRLKLGEESEARIKSIYLVLVLFFLLATDMMNSSLRLEWISFCLTSLVTAYKQLKRSLFLFGLYVGFMAVLDIVVHRVLLKHFSKHIFSLATIVTQTHLIYQIRGFDSHSFYFWIIFMGLSISFRKAVSISNHLLWVPTHVIAYGLYLSFIGSFSLYLEWCKQHFSESNKGVSSPISPSQAFHSIPSTTSPNSSDSINDIPITRLSSTSPPTSSPLTTNNTNSKKEDISICVTFITSTEIRAAFITNLSSIPETIYELDDVQLFINGEHWEEVEFSNNKEKFLVRSLTPQTEYQISARVDGKLLSSICVWTSEATPEIEEQHNHLTLDSTSPSAEESKSKSKTWSFVDRTNPVCHSLLQQLTLECSRVKEAQTTLRKLKKDHMRRKLQLQNDIEHLKESIKKASSQEIKQSQRFQFLEEFVRKQFASKDSLKQMISQKEEEKKHLLNELSIVRKNISEKKSEVKRSEKSLSKCAQANNKKLDILSAELSQLREGHSRVSRMFMERRQERLRMEKELSMLSAKIQVVKEQSDKLRQECLEAEEFTGKYNLEMQNSHSTLEQLIASLQLRKKGFEEAIQKENSFMKLLMKELDNLRKEKEDMPDPMVGS